MISSAEFVEEYYGIKLTWFQKLILNLFKFNLFTGPRSTPKGEYRISKRWDNTGVN